MRFLLDMPVSSAAARPSHYTSSPRCATMAPDAVLPRWADGQAGSMKVRELVRLLERNGWVLRRTRGSHRQFVHPDRRGVVTVSGNLGREVPAGTLNAVLKAAGLKGEA